MRVAFTLTIAGSLVLYISMGFFLKFPARIVWNIPMFQNNQSVYTNQTDSRGPVLVDVTEFMEENGEDFQQQIKTNISHKLLWYNLPLWSKLPPMNRCIKDHCSYKNCEFTADKKAIKQMSALIFSLTTAGIPAKPPLNNLERPINQVWVFFGMESPVYTPYPSGLRSAWKYSMNWSMSYRTDSDILIPYGYLVKRRTSTQSNYTEAFRKKKRFAAWLVSHCRTQSSRAKFVQKLKMYGLEVDIYGRCGERLNSDPLEMISTNYKFYLSFENTICSDYVTENFFRYYPLNTILIVRGGADYTKLFPSGTYINTADFGSFKELVTYLKYVASNETLYTEYLARKHQYESFCGIDDNCPSYCKLCRKLNNLENNKKVYSVVPDYRETCNKPEDIHKMDNDN